MGKCTRCNKNNKIKDGLCFRCFRKEHKGKYPYESMRQQKRKSSLKVILQSKKRNPEMEDFISSLKNKKHNHHVLSILCLCSRELNRILEKYVNEFKIEVQDIRLINKSLRKIEVQHAE